MQTVDDLYWLADLHCPDTFAALWKTYHRKLSRYASSILGTNGETEDIATDVLVKLWERRHTMYPEEIRRWLYICVKNRCFDVLRRREIYLRIEDDLSCQSEVCYTIEEFAIDIEIQRKKVKAVLQTANLLPEACRKVFKMYYVNKLKTREIALRLGISEQTVRNQKSTAIGKLRGMLRPEFARTESVA